MKDILNTLLNFVAIFCTTFEVPKYQRIPKSPSTSSSLGALLFWQARKPRSYLVVCRSQFLLKTTNFVDKVTLKFTITKCSQNLHQASMTKVHWDPLASVRHPSGFQTTFTSLLSSSRAHNSYFH